jgi:phosphoribulokinase
MSVKYPIIAVTGSSGAGTTTVQNAFAQIFRRENVNAVYVEGDSFHRYNRAEMKQAIADSERAGGRTISHFGPETNLFDELEGLFRQYGQSGSGRVRRYLHNEQEAAPYGLPPGTFTAWETLPEGSDLMFYEGLHGGVVTGQVNVARHVDLLIGVVPIINLEWIQKIHRDTRLRGYSREAVRETILRRMHDYVHYICPQFTQTHINFQRVPTVDTSNPFIAEDIPSLDESFVVIRFRNPVGVDFPYLLTMIHDSFMSRPNNIVVPGGKMGLAMQLIVTPMIWRLMEDRKRLTTRSGPVEHAIGVVRSQRA